MSRFSSVPRPRLFGYCVITAIVVLSVIGGLLATGLMANNTSNQRKEYGVLSKQPLSTYMELLLSVQAFDPVAQTFKYSVEFAIPDGHAEDLANPNPRQNNYYEVGVSMNVTIGTQTFTYGKGAVLYPVSGSSAITGDLAFYPSDNYVANVPVKAFFGPNRTDLPVQLLAYNIPNGWKTGYFIQEDENELVVNLLVYAERNTTVKTFAVVIMSIMWGLALSATILASIIHFLSKKVEPPILAMTIALLFAMPGVRNTMPGAPPVGALADELVLVWTMTLLSLSCISYFVRLIIQQLPPKEQTSSGKP
ncbi:hypothetical protein BC830DRAFT_1106080 [Chytriomyces sp. MP71]|nr:hypothetical protein BC830DRAFT_1106080 [Chytriomyces sp. MP71]